MIITMRNADDYMPGDCVRLDGRAQTLRFMVIRVLDRKRLEVAQVEGNRAERRRREVMKRARIDL